MAREVKNKSSDRLDSGFGSAMFSDVGEGMRSLFYDRPLAFNADTQDAGCEARTSGSAKLSPRWRQSSEINPLSRIHHERRI